MVPYNLTYQVKNNITSVSRIDDAMTRILRVKFIMGLFENPLADLSLVNQLGSKVHFLNDANLIYAEYSIQIIQFEIVSLLIKYYPLNRNIDS